MSKEIEDKIKNLLRLFFQSIKEYENEVEEMVCHDERRPEEFVNIFVESSDAFDYEDILNNIDSITEENQQLQRS